VEIKISATPSQKCAIPVQWIFHQKDRVKVSARKIVKKKGILDLTFKDTGVMRGAILMVARNL